MILQTVNQQVNRQQYSYAAVVLLNPHKHYPRFQAQCSNMLEEQLGRTFKLIRYSFLQKSASEEKLKLKPKPIQKSQQKLKSQKLKLRQAYLIYHNHTCEIIHSLIKRQLGIYASVIPFSKYMCLHYGPTKKTTKQVKNELRTKLIPFRWFDKGLQDEFNLGYDQQDRTIQGYFKLLQEGFNMEFCKENWEKLKERIFLGEQKTYRYVKRVYWNFEN